MTPPQRVFLQAEWKHLALFNYRVPDEVLLPYLPSGCELDRFDGSAFISLVAFQFLNTRVLGIRWSGYVNFPEINLRFYITLNGKRGVCFIREYVPSHLITGIARLLYNEPYKTAQMTDDVATSADGEITAKYELNDGGHRMSIEVVGENNPIMSGDDSPEHFFKEHELGVGRDRAGKTVTYNVRHPHWRIFPLKHSQIRIDWTAIYGPQFHFLQDQSADSVFFAEGSEIKVYGKTKG
jgi:hypothetical protein